MKTIFLTLALLFSTLLGFSQNSGITITVTVDNATSDNGKVLFALHTQNTFMKSNAVQVAANTIENGKVKVEFKNVEPGTYAIMVLHDENENQQMDFETNGMPKENYAVSNNSLSYGPPKFDDAKFEVTDKDLHLQIRF